MTKIPGCQVVYENHQEILGLIEAERVQWSKDRPKKRMMELVAQSGTPPAEQKGDSRRAVFQFLRSPVEIKRKADGGLRSLTTVVNALDTATQKVTPTGRLEEIECDMVLRSIGYKSLPLSGVPFDHKNGLVPNINGRVCTDATLVSNLSTRRFLSTLGPLKPSCAERGCPRIVHFGLA